MEESACLDKVREGEIACTLMEVTDPKYGMRGIFGGRLLDLRLQLFQLEMERHPDDLLSFGGEHHNTVNIYAWELQLFWKGMIARLEQGGLEEKK